MPVPDQAEINMQEAFLFNNGQLRAMFDGALREPTGMSAHPAIIEDQNGHTISINFRVEDDEIVTINNLIPDIANLDNMHRALAIHLAPILLTLLKVQIIWIPASLLPEDQHRFVKNPGTELAAVPRWQVRAMYIFQR